MSRRDCQPGPGARLLLTLAALLGWACLFGDEPKPAPRDPDLAGQRRMCFPDGGGVRTFRRGGAILWTDSPVDGSGLLKDTAEAEAFLTELLPPAATTTATAPAARPVALAVYSAEADYRALWRRVGEHYGGAFGRIRTEGYSYRVFCATYYGDAAAFPARRPVLCHEFAHVWLHQRHGLANDGNWLTEGLANAVQLRLFPDSGDRGDFARWLAAGRMLPLKRLMDQKRIAPKDYWQAATLVELLAARHRRKLPAVVRAFNRGRSAYAIVSQVLETDFLTLEKHWAEHVRATAAAARSRPAAEERSPAAGE